MQTDPDPTKHSQTELYIESIPNDDLHADIRQSSLSEELTESYFYTDNTFSFSIEEKRRVVLRFNPLMAKAKEIDFVELFFIAHRVTEYLSGEGVRHGIEIVRNGDFRFCVVLDEKRGSLMDEMKELVVERLRTNF